MQKLEPQKKMHRMKLKSKLKGINPKSVILAHHREEIIDNWLNQIFMDTTKRRQTIKLLRMDSEVFKHPWDFSPDIHEGLIRIKIP